jgi:hypothetical protein
VTQTADAWTARIAVALCVANRWQAAGGLAVTVFSLLALAHAHGAAFTFFALGAVFGALQIYLAVRIEFDRAIFAAAVQTGFEGFDEALGRLGWRPGADMSRSVQARAAGLASLVKRSAALLVAQLGLVLAGLWLR